MRHDVMDELIEIDKHTHVELTVKKEERKNDFQIELVVELEEKPLIKCDVGVGFSRTGEMCGKLSARYKFRMESDFNERVYDKMKIPNTENNIGDTEIQNGENTEV